MRRMNGEARDLIQLVIAPPEPEALSCAVPGCAAKVAAIARVALTRISFCDQHRARLREFSGQPCGPLKHLHDEIRRLAAEDLNHKPKDATK
jgi:hypothetical protein